MSQSLSLKDRVIKFIVCPSDEIEEMLPAWESWDDCMIEFICGGSIMDCVQEALDLENIKAEYLCCTEGEKERDYYTSGIRFYNSEEDITLAFPFWHDSYSSPEIQDAYEAVLKEKTVIIKYWDGI